MILSYFIAVILSYLIGSIPFGYVLAFAKGINIREHGSGNIGATNVGRILGKKYGIIIFVLDVLKGFLTVLFIPILVSNIKATTTPNDLLVVLCGLCVVLGHAFPAYIGFKGGKAVATSFGVFIWLAPIPIAIAFGIWVLTVAISRYVSLGSIISSLALTGVIIVFENGPFNTGLFLTALSIAISVLIILKHISNIRRIIAGTENKVFKN